MANVVYRDDFTLVRDSWTDIDGWLVFDNKLVGVDHIRLNLPHTGSSVSIRLLTPVDETIQFDKTVAHVSDWIEVHFPIKTQPNDNDKVIFRWEGNEQEVIIDEHYSFYTLSIQGDKDEFIVYKEFDEDYGDDFITGTGYHSLESYVNNNKLYVKPGYFYINNQEYYMFNDMGVLDVDTEVPSGTMPSGVYYIPGEPYFVVPSGNIDTSFDYIKTPSNVDYDVTWEEPTIESSGFIPYVTTSLAGYKLVYEISEDDRYLIPSGIDPSGTILPILDDDSYLVLASGTPEIGKLEQYPIWLDYGENEGEYEFYTYVEDKYGSPMENADVTWYYHYIDGDDNDFTGLIGTSQSNVRGIARSLYLIPSTAVDVFIWATGSAFSNVRWVQIPLDIVSQPVAVFQLDNPGVRWDCLQARCALGHNIWEEEWGTNAAEETGLGAGGGWEAPWETHGDWETDHMQYMRPPIHHDGLLDYPGLPGRAALYALGEAKDMTSGIYNIKDYMQDKGTYVAASGVVPFGGEMWCTFDGFWGQFRIRGQEIQNPANAIDCLNPAESLYNSKRVDSFDDFQGLYYCETPQSFNDVLTGDSSLENIYYVFYYDGNDYSLSNHPTIRDEILAGTKSCYYRGVVIYPIALESGTNVNEAFKQDWQIKDIISGAEIIH